MYMYINETPCYTLETNTTLQIYYTSIEKKSTLSKFSYTKTSLNKYEQDKCMQSVNPEVYFTAALFTITKTCKQPKCPLTDKWMKKMWHIHMIEY